MRWFLKSNSKISQNDFYFKDWAILIKEKFNRCPKGIDLENIFRNFL